MKYRMREMFQNGIKTMRDKLTTSYAYSKQNESYNNGKGEDNDETGRPSK